MAKHHKPAETEVILALWPDHPVDAAGAVRDWRDAWDGSGPDTQGRTCYVEVKSQALRGAGFRRVRSVLQAAYAQLSSAIENLPRAGRLLGSDLPHLVAMPIAVWRPTGLSGIGNALVYHQFLDMIGAPILQFLDDFRETFIAGYDMGRWREAFWRPKNPEA